MDYRQFRWATNHFRI